MYLALDVRRVQCPQCGAVKTEGLEWLADNPLYTKRFAFYVGRRCRESSIKALAEELRLDWHAVKDLDKQYMREQLRRVGCPAPRAIGRRPSLRSPADLPVAPIGLRHPWRRAARSSRAGRTADFSRTVADGFVTITAPVTVHGAGLGSGTQALASTPTIAMMPAESRLD